MSNRGQRRAAKVLERRQKKAEERRLHADVAAHALFVSQRQQHLGSLSRAQQAADRHAIGVLEQVDPLAGLRNGLRQIAADKDHWAGIPMPLEGQRLVIEPTYPNAEALSAMWQPERAPPEADGAKIRNTFWSWRYRTEVVVWEEADGRILGAPTGRSNHASQLLNTLHAADAWGIEQERNAIDTLGTLLRHRQFKQYLLTGMFMEQSRRSGVHYLFRRLRPTLAISGRTPGFKILAALCMHSIGYYEDSWAGAMCPTDDVISHLALMRGDEHMFWRRCNQHAPFRREAGI